jgi:hypothetical protein
VFLRTYIVLRLEEAQLSERLSRYLISLPSRVSLVFSDDALQESSQRRPKHNHVAAFASSMTSSNSDSGGLSINRHPQYTVMRMEIQFLYFEDCPSHEEALSRLRKVLKEEEITTEISIEPVETEEQATRLHFAGSPTILIDGRDIDPQPHPYYALTCRAYRLEDGRISPLPSITMIRRAVRTAKEKERQNE